MVKKNTVLEGAIFGMTEKLRPGSEEYYKIVISSAEYDSGKIEGYFQKVDGYSSNSKNAIHDGWYKFKKPGLTLTFSSGELNFDLQTDNDAYDPLSGTIYENGTALGKFTFKKVGPNFQLGYD